MGGREDPKDANMLQNCNLAPFLPPLLFIVSHWFCTCKRVGLLGQQSWPRMRHILRGIALWVWWGILLECLELHLCKLQFQLTDFS